MSLPTNNKKDNKQGSKGSRNAAAAASKFIAKPGKGANVAKKPVKTGGTRGS